jgi:hypothetical protein
MNVNVLIAKRERDLHLGACLYFLNEAAKRQDDDIVVYVVDEYLSEENISLPLSSYSHITAHKISMPSCSDELFNKSRLLNTGFTLMRQNYDWVGIVDVDMIYQPHYFVKVGKVLSDNKRATCLSKGFSLDSLHSSFILNGRMVLPDPSLTLRYNGNSQIALTRYAVELIKDIYGGEIYCEDFKGWGGEDSDMSFRLKDLIATNLLTQQRVDCMWYHLWHEPRHDLDDANKKLFDKRRVSNQQLLQRWLNENKHRNTHNKD